MSQAIIPAAVLPLGPYFNRLPNELLLEIFKLMIKVSPMSVTGVVIDKQLFDFMFKFGPLSQFMKVSKAFSALVIQAFYEINQFTFRPTRGSNQWLNALPAQVPWSGARHFLRRIILRINMEDSYWTLTRKEAAKPLHLQQYHAQPITSVDQIHQYCPGTVQLLHLTNAISGFSCLRQINLRICTIIHSGDINLWLRILKDMNIVLRARKVSFEIRDRYGHPQSWHHRLMDVIHVD